MHVARTRQELARATCYVRQSHPSLVLVPTMGALHAGHVSLVAHAREIGGGVIASIFVNPTQFSDSGDFNRYPRDEAGDLALLAQAGCDAVWLPQVTDMYDDANATAVDVAGPALGWEGDARPGHFRGVATVVAKLFGQVRPDIACFGEKDWQQLQVIRRVERDLALNVRIAGVPTLRESDGLALSSRNRFLTQAERRAAPLLYATMLAAARDIKAAAAVDDRLGAARHTLAASGFAVDYLALVDGETMSGVSQAGPGTRLIAAARLGSVRLLDNVAADESGTTQPKLTLDDQAARQSRHRSGSG